MNYHDKQRFFNIFNQFGFVILEHNPPCEHQCIKQNLLFLSDFFGTVKQHKRSNKDGISIITPLEGYPDYIATTNKAHLLHTDGTFEQDAPKIVALQCEIPSKEGGLSQIIQAESIYEYLSKNDPQGLQKCFMTDAFTIVRHDQTATKPIFKREKQRILMEFRSDSTAFIQIKLELKETFKLIKEYINNPKNQFIFKLQANQILITDNTRILHGRTSFPDYEVRKLNRLWFNGESKYSHLIRLGFLAKTF
ncbi:hypothetical protein OSCI_3890022 [Kamptonema sp. PCC 6506]|nr:hypothetical protein OSCI_3890022 [Kamptonema sp. PCC 6506]